MLRKNVELARHWIALGALLVAPAVGATVPTITGDIFTVNDNTDLIDDNVADGVCHTAANTCTLRAAIMQANRSTGLGATIVLPAGTYRLTRARSGADGEDSGDLNLTTPASGDPQITIQGAGEAVTTIDANQIDGAINVAYSRTAAITGLTIQNGLAGGDGGGILNAGYLSLDHVRLVHNSAQAGGAIYSFGASAVLVAAQCEFDANTAVLAGGALFNNAAARITTSTFAFNSAMYGGGIENYGGLTLIDSTVAANEASKDGGGINSLGSPTTLTNIYSSTIVYNDADQDRDGNGSGGGVHVSFTSGSGGTFAIRNTLITGNTVGNTPLADDCSVDAGAYLYSYGVNLVGTSDGCTISTVNGFWDYFVGNLGALQNNGGPTGTVALLNVGYNNAIDAGAYPQGCVDDQGNTILTDQRGFKRSAGAWCDVGAYEYDPDRIFANGFE